MAKYCALLALVLAATLALTVAEPPRFRGTRRNGRLRWLARQEEVDDVETSADVAPAPADAAAPYPPAGVTPEIPFDLPTETEAAIPDPTYGPPDGSEAAAAPDSTYGPPADEATAAAPAGDLVLQNLIQPRNRARNSALRSQQLLLRAAPAGAAPRAGVVEIVRAEPGLIYVLK